MTRSQVFHWELSLEVRPYNTPPGAKVRKYQSRKRKEVTMKGSYCSIEYSSEFFTSPINILIFSEWFSDLFKWQELSNTFTRINNCLCGLLVIDLDTAFTWWGGVNGPGRVRLCTLPPQWSHLLSPHGSSSTLCNWLSSFRVKGQAFKRELLHWHNKRWQFSWRLTRNFTPPPSSPAS